MQQSAVKMISGMLAVGLVIFVVSGQPLVLVIMAAVGYVTWQVAQGLDG